MKIKKIKFMSQEGKEYLFPGESVRMFVSGDFVELYQMVQEREVIHRNICSMFTCILTDTGVSELKDYIQEMFRNRNIRDIEVVYQATEENENRGEYISSFGVSWNPGLITADSANTYEESYLNEDGLLFINISSDTHLSDVFSKEMMNDHDVSNQLLI